MDEANLWSRWLGPAGHRPPPLDRFLARELRGRRDGGALAARLFAAAAWAVTAWCLLTEVDPEELPTAPDALLDGLREADPRRVVALTSALGRVGRAPDRLWTRVEPAWHALQARTDTAGRLLAAGIPPGWAPWLAPRLQRWGPAAERWLAAQSRRPPLWARPGGRDSPRDVAVALRREGLEVEVHGDALRVQGSRAIRSTTAYRSGRVEVQDLASQAVAGQLELAPGQRVWDVCAGRGGKTVQIARALGGRGLIWATDTDARARDALKQRLRRTGWADNVRVLPWDGVVAPTWGRGARGGLDRALVDAPCGSSGTWRRNPDARLRPPPGTPEDWAALQKSLLRTALQEVRPSGLVVYATCSVLPVEDEDVVEAIAAEGQAELVSMGLHGCPHADADTLFAAVLRRPSPH